MSNRPASTSVSILAQFQHDAGSLAIDLQCRRTRVRFVALSEGEHEYGLLDQVAATIGIDQARFDPMYGISKRGIADRLLGANLANQRLAQMRIRGFSVMHRNAPTVVLSLMAR